MISSQQIEDGRRATGKNKTMMETAADSMVIHEDSDIGGAAPFRDRTSLGKEKGSPRDSSRKKEKSKERKKSKRNE